ncbi:PDZ/DHR/GLGF protein [Thioalkalivibrio nitratireducens DSM 14787]|uniref:PDZ/DHR/GLGF protein n=1 Tax=Thioalkalivibrio nitratireducens (strain DSM 14787 / UNIQEM 213 / ALEN2) TaxID=1255043 RepID=L0DVQ7_THIND|nr:ChaN family lipoprotein [Thioalkalivibrio nitratireducens]AGA33065.1 PDZ/DHR/GLGF protein [Thioalkalivibrio nitratireducens DSM 14787]
MTRRIRRAGPLSGLVVLAILASGHAAAGCPAPGQWLSGDGNPLATDQLFLDLEQPRIVLLGETHDRMEHHRWQLHTLAGLHALRPGMAIGLEMLPREAQPALDAWVGGELDEPDFLEQSNWSQAWGFDPQLYLPILHFARMHGVPLLAINLERSLVRRLASEGWEAIAPEQRHGISPPAPATEAYRDYLDAVLQEHPAGAMDDPDLDRFVAGQLVWDRAMAAGLADAAEDYPLVVGLMGSGHLQYRYGVPHQLADLGIGLEHQRTLLPWNSNAECSAPEPGIADAIFGVVPGTAHEPRPPQLLGVRIEPDPAGVRVHSVQPDSVADASGLQADDILTAAAGLDLELPGDLVAIIRRQAPGTILPLTVLRDGETREVLARFPARVD